MKVRTLIVMLFCVVSAMLCGTAWALDEAVLTPTPERVGAMSEKESAKAEKEFNAAMSVWLSHDYKNGEKLLEQFAAKNPNSKWRAEAELHCGCYFTFTGQKSKAKPIFQRLMNEFAGTNIAVKARLRLASIFEQEANLDEAISLYTQVLKLNPTWDQFKYANFHARNLVRARSRRQALINCGPVALASCLQALGKDAEAAKAGEISVTPDGLSLASLELSCLEYGVPAKSVEMTLDELQKADLPVLAYVEPKHFIAVLEMKDGKAQVEDSIRGKYEASFEQLKSIWAGKVLTFAPKDDMKPLAQTASVEAVGGCCAQIAESECQGCPGHCAQGEDGGNGEGGSPGGGHGGGTMQLPESGCATCGGGGGGGNNGGSPCCPVNPGRPDWKMNVQNMNLLVSDTPIWYNPGRGYNIAFTLNYSNESSNTGIFGHGWRCVYDMKVFYEPAGQLQVHKDDGRIETYYFSGGQYVPRSNLGYRDKIEILDATQATAESRVGSPVYTGSARITRRGGGKYFFLPASYPPETQGRIYIIEDKVGNRVTCDYTGDKLSAVIDANGGVTDIDSTGTGSSERVISIHIPRFVDGAWEQWSEEIENPELWRHADLVYNDDLNLVSITDMGGSTSTLTYGRLGTYGTWDIFANTTLAQNVTADPLVPDNRGTGTLTVASTDGFPDAGRIMVTGPEFATEIMTYEGKTGTDTLTGIRRGEIPIDASTGNRVETDQPWTTLSNDITATEPPGGENPNLGLVSTYGFPNSGSVQVGENQVIDYTSKSLNPAQLGGITRRSPASWASAGTSIWAVNHVYSDTPYLYTIETPSKKTKFAYEQLPGFGLYGLHEVYERGPTETNYPTVPTIHYVWCGGSTTVTRYPTSVVDGADCFTTPHWVGGLTRRYDAVGEDALGWVVDVVGGVGYTVVGYEYNGYRDRSSVTDANGRTTIYDYGTNGQHNIYSITDPLNNTRAFTYYPDHSLHTETDAYSRVINTYTYNSKGQVTRIDKPLGIYMTYDYDDDSEGNTWRLESSTDGRGKITTYSYDDPRGFLTSVTDPESNTTHYEYDECGRLDSVEDPSGNVTQYQYDNLDRLIKTIHGSGENDPYTETMYTCCHKIYDRDENGKRVYYIYDVKMRSKKTITSAKSTTLASIISPTQTTLPLTSAEGFLTPGRVVIEDEIITYTGIDGNSLTGAGRGAEGTIAAAHSTDDPVGRVDTVPATYVYDSQYLDRMVSLTDALAHTTQYAYYDNGKLKTIRYPDDKGEQYTYDANNSGPNLITKQYGTFSGAAFTPTDTLTIHYDYDWNNRLLRTYH